MSHLIAISVGPVQDFIAAARKTRDLWFGSFLLSEISKAVALAVAKDPNASVSPRLIFPAPKKIEELAPSDGSHPDYLSVANVILAVVEHDPTVAAKTARKAAREYWADMAAKAFKEANRGEERVSKRLWDHQVEDVIEFYAAWVPYDDNNYKEKRRRVMRLLAGRKACRTFKPSPKWFGLAKSSLDGARETVLTKKAREDAWLRLRSGEELDAVGITKRMALGRKQYPSITRVAVDPWLRGVEQASKTQPEVLQAWNELKDKCSKFEDVRLSSKYAQYRSFPYDGSVVLPNRWEDLIEEAKLDPDDLKALEETLKQLNRLGFPNPDPYVAVLLADGDGVGAAISEIENLEDHQKLSKTLADFATSAREIVKNHHGTPIYTGGDDVLAILPLDRVIACARKLHDEFAEFARKLPLKNAACPTFSVGIAIGHCMEALEDFRVWAKKAEKSAKTKGPGGKKDALAIHFYTRGGPPIEIRRQWDPKNPIDSKHTTPPDDDMNTWARRFWRDELADKVAYDLRVLALEYQNTSEWEAGRLQEAMLADVKRLLKAKTNGTSEEKRKVLEELRDLVERLETPDDLLALCSEILIARKLAVAIREAEGQPHS